MSTTRKAPLMLSVEQKRRILEEYEAGKPKLKAKDLAAKYGFNAHQLFKWRRGEGMSGPTTISAHKPGNKSAGSVERRTPTARDHLVHALQVETDRATYLEAELAKFTEMGSELEVVNRRIQVLTELIEQYDHADDVRPTKRRSPDFGLG